MGNKQSILCCSPSCCSTRHDAIRPRPAKIQSGLKEPSEHPKASVKPKSGNGTSAGNGGSQRNISGPKTPLNIKDEIAEIQCEINKELQIKDGAEKLRTLIKKRKHLKDVTKFLEKSNAKLEKLNRRLQYLNTCAAEQDAVKQPDKCEENNEEKAVHPGEDAVSPNEISNMVKAVVPLIEPINEIEVVNVDNVTFPKPDNGCIQPKLPSSLEDFRCCSVLGRGAFGKVLLAEHKATRKMVALKAMKKVPIFEANDIRSLMIEKQIFQTVSRGRHPCLVNLFGSFQNFDHVFFSMEYAAGGDLHSQIEKASGSFPFSRAQFYAACVVLGLEYLQKEKIIHRDLKLANIVLDNKGYAKITDFGLSKAGIGFGGRTKTFCGTPQYMAPEIISQQSYTRAVDWWSLGVLIYVMLVGKMPFPGTTFAQLVKTITTYDIQYPKTVSVRSRFILRNLLQRNPAKRLGSSKNGAEDVKKDFFFVEINWSDLFSRKVKPPFVPTIEGLEDASKAENSVIFRDPLLTPQERSLTAEQQELFRDFDWVADWMD